MEKTDVHDALRLRRTHGYLEEWNNYTSGGLFTTTTGGSATATAGNSTFGILTLAAIDSSLNREVYVATTNALFALTASHNLYAECFCQFAEANTNKANVAFGFMNSVGAASMQDTTGEPKTTFSGAVIYKVPGGTVWKTCSSVGTTQTVTTSTTTAGGAAYHRLAIEINPVSATLAEVTYWVDDVQLQAAGGRPGQSLIKDQLTYTGAVNMQLFACLKNGSTTPETLLVDYMAWEQLRALFV
ncbi:MAG: hypothetical protein V4597_11570 [Pseudomonadota bacterium]